VNRDRHIGLTDQTGIEGLRIAEDLGPVQVEIPPQVMRSLPRIAREVEDALRRAARDKNASHVIEVRIALKSRLFSTGAVAEGRCVRMEPDEA
jgi:hypothetical protein